VSHGFLATPCVNRMFRQYARLHINRRGLSGLWLVAGPSTVRVLGVRDLSSSIDGNGAVVRKFGDVQPRPMISFIFMGLQVE